MSKKKYHPNCRNQELSQRRTIPDTSSMSVSSAAAFWSHEGWQPVPLHNVTGVPLIKWRNASKLSPDETFDLFERFHGCRLSIALPPGTVVLDIDHRPDKGWAADDIRCALEDRFNLPAGPTYSTPSKGTHHWYTVPSGCRPKNWTSQSGAFPIEGVDIRCQGGLATIPPTQRKDGDYEWIQWMAEIPEAPAQLVKALTPRSRTLVQPCQPRLHSPKNTSRYVEAIYRRELEAIRLSAPGNRNAQLFKSSASLGSLVAAGALPLGHVEESLMAAAAACGLSRDDGTSASYRTIQSGLQAGMAQPRNLSGAPDA